MRAGSGPRSAGRLRLTALATAAVALSLLPVASAHADSVSAQSGAVSATLSYEPDGLGAGGVTNLHLAIARGGQTLFDGALTIENCDQGHCVPISGKAGGAAYQPISVQDLDGDAEPEVSVWVFWGGAHCCTINQVFRLKADGSGYELTTHNFADPGAKLTDLDGDGRPEFLSADARFDYKFASFAGTGMPVQIWRYAQGSFLDVTGAFPTRVRKDAKRWWHFYRKALRSGVHADHLGALAAWAADEYRLGHRARTLRTLRSEWRHGNLEQTGEFTIGPSGRAFIHQLDLTLRRYGYGTHKAAGRVLP